MKMLKSVCVSGVFLLGGIISFVEAQDQNKETTIVGVVYTGEKPETKPQKSRAKRDYVVKQTFRQKVGKRSVTIQEVAPPLEKDKLGQKESWDVSMEGEKEPSQPGEYTAPKLIVVTATVYGKGKNTRSQITLWHDNRECVAVSRADFRIMSGFTQFKASGRPYFMLENIIDADSTGQKGKVGQLTTDRRVPSTGFVVTKIEDGDKESRQILRDLHKLYQVEQGNLRSAYEQRKRNGVRQKVPEPDKPVTIRFWKRDLSKENAERGAK